MAADKMKIVTTGRGGCSGFSGAACTFLLLACCTRSVFGLADVQGTCAASGDEKSCEIVVASVNEYGDFASSDSAAAPRRENSKRPVQLRGLDVLQNPYLNKGLAFSNEERASLGLQGLLAPRVYSSMGEQLQLYSQKFFSEKDCPTPMDKYHFLADLQSSNAVLYYRFLLENVEETMPIVYTPTVGQACTEFSDNYFRVQAQTAARRGLVFSSVHVQDDELENVGKEVDLQEQEQRLFRDIVKNWPQQDVEMIVITDGSRILGLGDLGVNGMGIPIGKLALYVAAAGFAPWKTLPVTVDMGTNNEALLSADAGNSYVGLRQRRPGTDDSGPTKNSSPKFYRTMENVMRAIKGRWPGALVQFEDFANEHAFGLLEQWRTKTLSFNDDIQGTAGVVLAGLLAALRIQQSSSGPSASSLSLRDQRIVFFGAGSSGIGVADLIAEGMYLEAQNAGQTEDDSGTKLTGDYYRKKNFWLLDSKGLVTTTRGDRHKMQVHKLPFARDDPPIGSLAEVIEKAKPTVLVGLAGLPGGAFKEDMIKKMDEDCAAAGLRPVIMALSNPTSKAECTAEQVYTWTAGRAIFASGSPFAPFSFPVPAKTSGKNGTASNSTRSIHTGQGNNMYIFPGVGYGAVRCGAKTISNAMFYEAANRLSLQVEEADLQRGSVYPELRRIREITAHVAAGVCEVAAREGVTAMVEPEEGWLAWLRPKMWWPEYEDYVGA